MRMMDNHIYPKYSLYWLKGELVICIQISIKLFKGPKFH